MALAVKKLPADAGDIRDVCLIPEREDPLEKEMATYSSIPAWRIPWTERPGGLQSTGLQRVRHILVTKQQLIQYDLILANYIGKDPISK